MAAIFRGALKFALLAVSKTLTTDSSAIHETLGMDILAADPYGGFFL